jgi:hypothetical protein
VTFASPRRLPRANSLEGRVVVLDIAFAAEGLGKGFAKTTGKFIEALGPRLAKWVDHHDHPLHSRYAGDERFELCTKADHGACPEMITPEMVRQAGPVDTILAHFDLDGMYAAAKWILGGDEPYAGADEDARKVDTRIGEPGPQATLIDRAIRARWGDAALQQQIINYLVGGMNPGPEKDAIDAASQEYGRRAAEAERLAELYEVDGAIAHMRVPSSAKPFDKTELLLLGQQQATVAVVIENGNVSIAAPFDSGLDFVELLELGGGMPTRVNIPEKRLADALQRIHEATRARDG